MTDMEVVDGRSGEEGDERGPLVIFRPPTLLSIKPWVNGPLKKIPTKAPPKLTKSLASPPLSLTCHKKLYKLRSTMMKRIYEFMVVYIYEVE